MRKMLMCIDFQNDFIEGGALAVTGGKEDVKRTIHFIQTHSIDKIVCSLDTHSKNQIFHQCYWKDENGKNPEIYTIWEKPCDSLKYILSLINLM